MNRIIFFFLLVSSGSLAQTGIGTATPDASAKLDISSTNKGFLPPRIALTALNSASPVTSPATGLLIFNTASAGSIPNQVTPGYYYWDGFNSKWVRLEDKADNLGNHTATDNIRLNGNYLSNDGGNEGIKIDNDGNVGIGTSSPNSKLDITGNVKISGGVNVSGSSNVTLQTPALVVGTSSGDEGGEIQLATAQTNQSLSGSVIVDVYRNQLRILESGGNVRGVNIDLSKAPSGASGELMWKKSDFVAAGTYISLDNLKVAVTTGGNRGLSIGAVSSNFEADVSGWYTVNGGSGGGTSNNNIYTTTASGSAFGWNFPTHGDMVQMSIRDKTNSRFYRVTMMIGAGYFSNFLSIERLY
jgi:hypothetical protein